MRTESWDLIPVKACEKMRSNTWGVPLTNRKGALYDKKGKNWVKTEVKMVEAIRQALGVRGVNSHCRGKILVEERVHDRQWRNARARGRSSSLAGVLMASSDEVAGVSTGASNFYVAMATTGVAQSGGDGTCSGEQAGAHGGQARRGGAAVEEAGEARCDYSGVRLGLGLRFGAAVAS